MPPARSGSSGKSAASPSPAVPKGMRILVVESDPVLALDAEVMLLRNGAAVVEVANSAVEALESLHGAAFDAALVDLHLIEGGSLEVAARLATLGVPFAFAAGYGGRGTAPAPFEDRIVVSRPYSEAALLSRLAKLLPAAR